ncbi:MAG: class I mannose-6-phosphate isomerase [Planctomycetes bacterium]|nr:class I mannose-6-phosphate isomerase [Planctomycetota bacterium]
MPLPEPCLFERRILPKVWGGRNLEPVLGIALPPGEPIGETWELFDRPEGSSRVRGKDTTLAELLASHGERVLGRGVATGHGGRFPLLLKFLDTQEALSLQVHPDDAQAAAAADSGKNEALVVLHAGPRARIVYGVRRGVGTADFARCGDAPEVADLVHSFRPEVGDCVFVPAGTVHATGPDVVAFEIQQNSDLTYRLHDWGRGRPVHVQHALEVLRTGPGHAPGTRPVAAPVPSADGGVELIATPWFRVHRHRLTQPKQLPTHGRFLTVTVLGGAGSLAWPGGTLPLGRADTALVPACTPTVTLTPRADLDLVVCSPGTS